MKTRFSTLDICAVLTEINSKLIGMRLANVYDINNKTYLLKLAKPDSKAMLLMESGIRLHISEFDWPKNMMPSGFSMKMRKHLKGRRLVSAKQLGIDRIVDMQFGSDEAAYHVILELYDRGNIILTDPAYTIINILRFRKEKSAMTSEGGDRSNEDNSDVRFAVHETYPLHLAKQGQKLDDVKEKLKTAISNAKTDDALRRVLNPHLPYGTACVEHCLVTAGFPAAAKIGKGFNIHEDTEKLLTGLQVGEDLLTALMKDSSQGYIIQKPEKKTDGTTVLTNIEFHPHLFKQYDDSIPHLKFDSFNKAVDEFFGNLVSQKADMKIIQQEKSAHRKLDHIRKDHEQRLTNLEKEQATDVQKAQLIEESLTLVDQAIRVVRTAIANQIDWGEISSLIKDAQINGDPVAMAITKLNLQSNGFTIALQEPGQASESSDDSSNEQDKMQKQGKPKKPKLIKIDIDLGLSAYGNAKKYYNKKRQASNKQQKIIDASGKALKSAEKKTTQTLKEAATIHSIQKARKTFWFEKFVWFISSENYLVIGGRDAQQNEILVKKYLTGGDVYVHADLHGATSCIIKNPTSAEIPPKTLNEAGTMAICHSAAWSAKVVTSAWWVHSHQVSKTAPSGAYLTTGSFLIRGKKNYLPPSYLIYGFGILFKIDETCIHKHLDERKVTGLDIDSVQDSNSVTETEESLSSELEQDLEIASDSDGSDSDPDNMEQVKPLSAEKNDEPSSTSLKQESMEESEEVKNDIAVVKFPETNVKFRYESLPTLSDEEDCDIVYLGDNEPVQVKWVTKKKNPTKQQSAPSTNAEDGVGDQLLKQNSNLEIGIEKTEQITKTPKQVCSQQDVPLKRGQRSKVKKLKNKFKDQDEEERLLKMELLQQSQSQKALDRKAKKNKSAAKPMQQPNGPNKKGQKTPHQRPKQPVKSQDNEHDSDEERNKVLQNEHLVEESIGILNSLTGCPANDDIILFALPVCAPYNTMNSYKFRVKLTPGNTKKGKGAKSALNLFQNMRETTSQEKDHFRSIKDHDLARNIPGKVKVSSTNLQLKSKKK